MKTVMLPTVLIVYVSLVINNVCGLESENILGGLTDKMNGFPYQVSIQVPTQHICGGTLIRSDIVLTAAHCVCGNNTYEYKNQQYVVVAGGRHVQHRNYKIPVERIYVHKRYIGYPDTVCLNDIALLKLWRSFDMIRIPQIRLARLPLRDEKFIGKTGIVSGFGWDQYLGQDIVTNKRIGYSSGNLKYDYVDILEPFRCGTNGLQGHLCGLIRQYKANVIQGVCSGDSGGPLMVDGKVVGIVSTGPESCNEKLFPTSYTQVSDYIDFIEYAMNGYQTTDTVIYDIAIN